MIVTLNTLASISMVTGIWPCHLGYLGATIFTRWVFLQRLDEYDTAIFYDYSINTINLLIAYHCFSLLTELLIVYIGHGHSLLAKLLVVLELCLQIYSLCRVSQVAYYLRSVKFTAYSSMTFIQFFLYLELLALPAYILSNTFFLAFRACFKHKLLAEVLIPKQMRVQNVDTRIALQKLVECFITEMFGFILWCEQKFVSIYFKAVDENTPKTLDIIINTEVTIMIIKMIITATHIFVGNNNKYIVKAKIIGYYFVYLIFPIFLIGLMIWFLFDKEIKATNSVFFVFAIVYTGTQFGTLCDYFVTQMHLLKKLSSRRKLRILFGQLKEQQKEIEMKNLDKSNLEANEEVEKIQERMKKIATKLDFNVEESSDVPYVQQTRLYGDGSLRIGQKIELSKELYTLMFISSFKHIEIEKYIDVVSGELVEPKEEEEEELEMEMEEKDHLETENLPENNQCVGDDFEKQSMKSPKSMLSSPKQGTGVNELEVVKLALLAQQAEEEDDDEEDLDKLFEEHEDQSKIEMSEEDLQKMLSVETMRTRRTIVMQNTLLCFSVQLLLCALIIWQIYLTNAASLVVEEAFIMVVFARVACAMILHMALMDEIKRALDLMKYAINHHYRFRNWWLGYIAGAMQASAVFMTELVCCLICAMSVAPMAIVYNFIACGIIADFDNYIFESFTDPLKRLWERGDMEEEDPVLKIHHTSSYRCKEDELSTEIDQETGKRMNLRVTWKSLPWGRKLGRFLYKICRVFYVSFYFYFMPYTVLLLNWIMPMVFYEGVFFGTQAIQV